MATPEALLRYADLTRQLLALAQAEKWDDWLQLLPAREACFAQWQAEQQMGQLSEESRAIVKAALQCNQQMELLVAARHQELADLLHSARQQQKLSSTYR